MYEIANKFHNNNLKATVLSIPAKTKTNSTRTHALITQQHVWQEVPLTESNLACDLQYPHL